MDITTYPYTEADESVEPRMLQLLNSFHITPPQVYDYYSVEISTPPVPPGQSYLHQLPLELRRTIVDYIASDFDGFRGHFTRPAERAMELECVCWRIRVKNKWKYPKQNGAYCDTCKRKVVQPRL